MKKIISGLFLLAAVGLLAGCGPGDQANKSENAAEKGEQNQSQEQKQEREKASLLEIMKRGKAMQCQWSTSSESGQYMSGTVYVSGDKFRQEMEFDQADGGTSYVVSDGETVYMWTAGTNQGTKMNLEEMKKNQQAAPEENQQSNDAGEKANLNEEYEFDCDSWSADSSKFQAPEGINFVDLTKQMNQLQEGAQNLQKNADQMKESACSMCQSLPEPGKSNCLESCNQ